MINDTLLETNALINRAIGHNMDYTSKRLDFPQEGTNDLVSDTLIELPM